jgi:hypothetical protein
MRGSLTHTTVIPLGGETFSADVSPVTYHCWLDGKFSPADPADSSKPAPCDPAGQTYENLGLGDHLFAVRAVDQYGNIGVWEDTEFRVMPSEAVIIAAPANGTSTTSTFRFTSEPRDPEATFYCSLDGSILYSERRSSRGGLLGKLIGPHVRQAWQAAARAKPGEPLFADGEPAERKEVEQSEVLGDVRPLVCVVIRRLQDAPAA